MDQKNVEHANNVQRFQVTEGSQNENKTLEQLHDKYEQDIVDDTSSIKANFFKKLASLRSLISVEPVKLNFGGITGKSIGNAKQARYSTHYKQTLLLFHSHPTSW